jgi:hypothetical protein
MGNLRVQLPYPQMGLSGEIRQHLKTTNPEWRQESLQFEYMMPMAVLASITPPRIVTDRKYPPHCGMIFHWQGKSHEYVPKVDLIDSIHHPVLWTYIQNIR